jgi:hypothetical protein
MSRGAAIRRLVAIAMKGEMRIVATGMRIVATGLLPLSLFFAASPAWADGAQPVARALVEAATQCTASTIRAYALATCETSEAVIAAAIAKCGSQWETAASAMVDAANADPSFRRDIAESHRNARRLGLEKPTSNNNAFDEFLEKQKMIDTYRGTIVGFFRARHETDAFDARVAGPAIQCGSATH